MKQAGVLATQMAEDYGTRLSQFFFKSTLKKECHKRLCYLSKGRKDAAKELQGKSRLYKEFLVLICYLLLHKHRWSCFSLQVFSEKSLTFNTSFLCYDTISQRPLMPNICVLHYTSYNTVADISKKLKCFLNRDIPLLPL